MSAFAERRRAAVAAARVYLIWTPEAAGGDPLRAARLALLGGHVDLVQLRVKDATPAEREEAGRALLTLCREVGVPLVVNDDIEVAQHLRADGVHLGQDDASPEAAREALGPHALIGLSTHGPEEIADARGRPVDYVGLGPCFATSSKALDLEPGGAELVRRSLSAAGSLPVFPIGGITPERVPELAAVGARAVAVGAGVLAADDPAAAAEAIHRALAPVP